MFIRLNIQILEQKLILVKYDVNLNHHLLNCALMFVYFIQKGKLLKFIKNDCMNWGLVKMYS